MGPFGTYFGLVARPERFELPTTWFEGVCLTNHFLLNQ